jgi:hypothetical protein
MSSNNSFAFIDKLTGRDNYPTWRFAVQTYLQHEELWSCVEGSGTVDPKLDTKARSKIILLVDPVNYVHIQEATTAKEVWTNLENAFNDSGLTRRVGLLRDLITTTLNGCHNIEEYVSKVMSTAHKLRNIGFKVDDEWLGTLLLSGLPETYQPMILAMESSGVKISADSVKAKLLQDVRQSDSSAFAANFGHGSNRKGYTKNCNETQTSKGPRCYTCNKYGHISKECKSKNKRKSQCSSYAAAFVATTSNDNSWFVDSGASAHLTKHQDILFDATAPSIKYIKVADDKSLSVKSCGQVSLDVCNTKGEQNKILLKNVLYVPDLATNLLSVSQIIKSGGQVRFNA